jgi:translation initiation factor IF-3
MDYQKYLFNKKKHQQKPKKVEIKEIQLGSNIGEHDFQFKLNQAKKFLSDGKKVKTTILFKGRTITRIDSGEKVMLRFVLELEEFGSAEQLPKMEGKKMIMIINPKKK